jgi:hypothetical protein
VIAEIQFTAIRQRALGRQVPLVLGRSWGVTGGKAGKFYVGDFVNESAIHPLFRLGLSSDNRIYQTE